MANVEIRNVEKNFGSVKVIQGVDVDIADGEFVVLVGPSGCGKSTLLRMIAGLEPINGGTISIGGKVVNGLPPKDRDIAMVFQSYALYPHKTVKDNIAFPLKMAKRPQAEIDEKVNKAAASLDLTRYLGRYPKELSGGQRQRVAMGRAIVRDPQVFLFDEPLSNLDAKLRVGMRVEIKELHQRLKTTTVYVTHDQIEAMTMANKIVVMKDGRVEQMGRPLDIYDKPANQFVAGFIGSPSMNFLKGKVTKTKSKASVVTEGGVELPLATADVDNGHAVTYGIRPEHITIGNGGISVDVSVIEPTGSETLVFGRIGGAPIDALIRERIDLEPGKATSFVIDTRRVHLFDRDSGTRI